MNEEEKKAKEKEQEDADFEAEIADLTDEEKEAKRAEKASHIDNSTDYDAELEAERKRAEKAEKALAKDRFKDSKNRRKEDEESEEDDDLEDNEGSKPITKKDIQSILAKERQVIHKEAWADRIHEIATEISSSPSEAALIIEIHKNRIFPSNLPLRDQLEESQAIANRKRNAAKTKELGRALKSKETASKDVATGHRDTIQPTTPKLDTVTAESYKRAGFSFNVKTKRYEKLLPDKSILVKDQRTGRVYRP